MAILSLDASSFVFDGTTAPQNRGSVWKRFLAFGSAATSTAYSQPLFLPQELEITSDEDRLVHDFQYVLIDPTLMGTPPSETVDATKDYKLGISWAVCKSDTDLFSPLVFDTEWGKVFNAQGPIHRGFRTTRAIKVTGIDQADTGDLIQIRLRRLADDAADTAEGFLCIFNLTIYKE